MLLVGSFSVAGLAILAGILPMLYPERGTADVDDDPGVRAAGLGRLLQVDVLPAWLQVFSHISPATYILNGIRGAHHRWRQPVRRVAELAALVVFGIVLIPGGMIVFAMPSDGRKRPAG